MMNSPEKELKESFSSVRPYISDPSDMKKEIEKISQNSSNLEESIESIENIISDEKDPTRKADYRILLNEIRKR